MRLRRGPAEPSPAPLDLDAKPAPDHEAHPLVLPSLTPARPRAAEKPEVTAPPDLADQLIKLAGLRDHGILTEEEFQTQKTRLLA
jgi:hypothetical protein